MACATVADFKSGSVLAFTLTDRSPRFSESVVAPTAAVRPSALDSSPSRPSVRLKPTSCQPPAGSRVRLIRPCVKASVWLDRAMPLKLTEKSDADVSVTVPPIRTAELLLSPPRVSAVAYSSPSSSTAPMVNSPPLAVTSAKARSSPRSLERTNRVPSAPRRAEKPVKARCALIAVASSLSEPFDTPELMVIGVVLAPVIWNEIVPSLMSLRATRVLARATRPVSADCPCTRDAM